MKKLLSIILCLFMCIGMIPSRALAADANKVPAFPGAEGAGMYATGGRGGDVYEVTTLDDYIPDKKKPNYHIMGSLRYGLTKSNVTIVFRVSGTIVLQDQLKVSLNNVTIAGETAPGDGICVSGYTTSITGNNVIMRDIRFRDGANKLGDAVTLGYANNMIIDHCSFSWSSDECLSIKDCKNVTVQYCIISDSLNMSIHGKGAHGYGGIWGGTNMSFHHNLLANHSSRNPRFDRDFTNDPNTGDIPLLVDFRNNVIYNWGANSTYGGESATGINMVGNYYKAGPSTFDSVKDRIVNPWSEQPGNYYVADNYVDGYPDITANNWNGGIQPEFGISTVNKLTTSCAIAGTVSTDSAQEAYKKVLAGAGAILPKRDSLDARITNDVMAGGGRIINTPDDDGGLPELNSIDAPKDSDHDGMPDSYETAHKLNPNDASDGKTINPDGYSNLEEYLHSLITTDVATNPEVTITSPAPNAIVNANSDVEFKAAASTTSGAISKVEFYNGSSKLGEADTAPYTFKWTNAPAGSYFIYAKAIDSRGCSTLSTALPLYVTNTENITAPWKSVDVGNVKIPGTANALGDTFTISGSGQIATPNSDNNNDSFHYVYQKINGDAELSSSIKFASEVDNGVKSGIMMRENLDPDSPFALIAASEQEKFGVRVKFFYRTVKGGPVIEQDSDDVTTPILVKMARNGKDIIGYMSADGYNWQKVGSGTLSFPDETYFGLAVDATKSTSNFDYCNTSTFEKTKLILPPDVKVNNPSSETVNKPEYTISGSVAKAAGWPADNTSGSTDTPSSQNTTSSAIYYDSMVDSNSTVDNGTVVNGVSVYKTVQAAVDGIPSNNTEHKIIFIKNGTYNEKVTIPADKCNISLLGESKDGTKITNNLNFNLGRQGCATMYVLGFNFTAENLTIENSYGIGQQELALDVEATRAIFKNCNILGHQDTIYAGNAPKTKGQSLHYFQDCYISGDTDFIYGNSTAIFSNCELNSFDQGKVPNGYVTAANTNANTKFGFVFLNCKLTSSAAKGSVYLGRPWGQYATVAYINCNLGAHINPDGWASFVSDSGTNTPDKASFYEYNCSGSGVATPSAINVTRRQLTDDQAKDYTLANIFPGWDPAGYMSTAYNKPSNKNNNTDTGAVLTITDNDKNVADPNTVSYGDNFSNKVTLNEGENVIKIIAKGKDDISTTKTINVTYNKDMPIITLTSTPSDNVTTSAFKLSGSISKDSTFTVALNGTKLIDSVSKAANDPFSVDLKFNEGENVLTITATDQYGNTSTSTYNVNYKKQWGTSGFTISNFAMKDLQGNGLTSLVSKKDTQVSAEFKNNASVSQNAVFVLALFDASNNIVSCSYSDESVASQAAKSLTAIFKMPETTTGYKLKAFVWDTVKDKNLMSDQIILP